MDTLSLRVLLVDDDEDDRHLIRQALTDAIVSIQIEEMTSGHDLVDWLDYQQSVKSGDSQPDNAGITIILLDMHMPKLTGLETLLAIGAKRDLTYMPVVMLTTSMDEPLKQQAYEHGIHLYMVKPESYRGVYRVVEAVKLCYRDALRMRDQLELG